MTENLLGDLAERLDPGLVAPVVLWLAAQECATTGEVYNVGGGRVARVVIAQTPGFFSREVTAEALRDNWDTVNDPALAEVMTSFQQEMGVLVGLLSGGDRAGAGG